MQKSGVRYFLALASPSSYSYRSALMGSIEAARQVGMAEAARATSATSVAMWQSVKRIAARDTEQQRLGPVVAKSPGQRQRNHNADAGQPQSFGKQQPRHCRAACTQAIRTPISRVRCMVSKASTP